MPNAPIRPARRPCMPCAATRPCFCTSILARAFRTFGITRKKQKKRKYVVLISVADTVALDMKEQFLPATGSIPESTGLPNQRLQFGQNHGRCRARRQTPLRPPLFSSCPGLRPLFQASRGGPHLRARTSVKHGEQNEFVSAEGSAKNERGSVKWCHASKIKIPVRADMMTSARVTSHMRSSVV